MLNIGLLLDGKWINVDRTPVSSQRFSEIKAHILGIVYILEKAN